MSEPLDLAEATRQNSSFSRLLPGLQLAVDSTSLGDFKICPRYYFYRIVYGWQTREESVHLTFGLLLHGARERYDHQRTGGAEHEEALRLVVAWVLRQTWNAELKRPWASDHATKNRLTLLRTVVWYLDQLGANDPLETVILANGRPAVELSFQIDTGYRSLVTGEQFTLCGHFDRLARLNAVPYIVDIKTTSYTLDPSWFKQFTPHNQFSTYTFSGKIAYHEPLHGLIVDGVRVLARRSEFQRGLVARDDAMLAEWHRGLGNWLASMEACAEEGTYGAGEAAWPQNDKNCFRFGRMCEFAEVCGRSPAARRQWLQANFRRRVWDPLVARGDI